MPSGVKWIEMRAMMGGVSDHRDSLGLADVPGPHRGRLRRWLVRNITNLLIRASDGALVKRFGVKLLVNDNFGGTGRGRQVLSYTPPGSSDRAYLVVHSDNGRTGYLKSGDTFVSDLRSIDGLETYTVLPFGGNQSPSPLPAGYAPSDNDDTVGLAVFQSNLVQGSHSTDPWLWDGRTLAEAQDIDEFPSNKVHDTAVPVAAMCAVRHPRWITPGTTIVYQQVGATETTMPCPKGPFQPGDKAWYLFAYETGVGWGVTPQYAQPFEGHYGPSPTADLPYVALMLRNAGVVADSAMSVPTPKWPGNRGVTGCRIYRTRINHEPRSVADFFYVGKKAVTGALPSGPPEDNITKVAPIHGNFLDTVSDADLGLEQPFGPPFVLPRFKHLIQHQGRMVMANLRSPRKCVAFVGALPLTDTIGSLTLKFVGGSPGSIEIAASGGTWQPLFKFYFKLEEKMGDMVARFNQDMRAYQGKITASSGQHLTGDVVLPCVAVLTGDPDVQSPSDAQDEWCQVVQYDSATYANRENAPVKALSSNPTHGTDTFDLRGRVWEFQWMPGNQKAMFYPSDVLVSDLKNPWVQNPFNRQGVGDNSQEEILGLARFRAPWGRDELLIGQRNRLYAMGGSLVDVDGILDVLLRRVSETVGFYHPNDIEAASAASWAESPHGIYFWSHRGIEFFDGARVTTVPISDDFADEMRGGVLYNNKLNRSMGWYDGKLYVSGVSRHARERLWIYDERIARMAGDPRAGWTQHHQWQNTGQIQGSNSGFLITGFGVWWSGTSDTNPHPILVGFSNTGWLYKVFGNDTYQSPMAVSNPFIDDTTATQTTDYWVRSSVVFETVLPNQQNRQLIRYIRPRFKHGKTTVLSAQALDLRLRIKLDDRPPFEVDIKNHCPQASEISNTTGGFDSLDRNWEIAPAIPVAVNKAPRARRVQVEIVSQDDEPLEIYGCDIAYVPSMGGVLGYAR